MMMETTTACMAGLNKISIPCRSARLKSWAVLALSVLAIIVFMFVLGPMGLKSAALKPMADFIEENNINANAYYYTEVEEFFEAERHMRENLRGHQKQRNQ